MPTSLPFGDLRAADLRGARLDQARLKPGPATDSATREPEGFDYRHSGCRRPCQTRVWTYLCTAHCVDGSARLLDARLLHLSWCPNSARSHFSERTSPLWAETCAGARLPELDRAACRFRTRARKAATPRGLTCAEPIPGPGFAAIQRGRCSQKRWDRQEWAPSLLNTLQQETDLAGIPLAR